MTTTVHVHRRLSASPRRVFDAFVDPAVVEAWFGPDPAAIVGLELAPHVGGRFSVVQRRGDEHVEVRGTYRQLDRPRRLVLTWAVPTDALAESLVTIDIEPSGSGAILSLTHELDPTWLHIVGDLEASWTRMLDAIAGALAPPAPEPPAAADDSARPVS